MTELGEDFAEHKSTRRNELADEAAKKPLRVAVLGPNLNDADNVGTRKRHQIADALRADGHAPFFLEDHVSLEDPSLSGVEQERQILIDREVDLVIILHTEDSAGVLVEIGNFASVPEISYKTGVLFPVKYYWPTQSLAGNTVQAYFARMQYTEEHLESCELVAECRRWAYERQSGIWPSLPTEGF